MPVAIVAKHFLPRMVCADTSHILHRVEQLRMGLLHNNLLVQHPGQKPISGDFFTWIQWLTSIWRRSGPKPRTRTRRWGPGGGGEREVEKETGKFPCYVMEFNEGASAEVLGNAKISFQVMKDVQDASGQCMYAPFADREEWELAKWLISNANQCATDKFLKLLIVSTWLS